MVDTTNVEEPDDLTSKQRAAELLEVEVGVSEDELQSAYQDAVLESHPDTGGDAELFKAVDDAREILLGERQPVGSSGPNNNGGGTQTRPGTTGRGGAGGTGATGASGAGQAGFGGFGGDTGQRQDGPDREVIYNAIRNLLRQQTSEERLKDKYGPEASMENVAAILTELIIAGGIDLGDVRKMLNDDFQFGSNLGEATGGLFGGDATGSGIFGGGGGLGSTDPNDYMGYGSSRGAGAGDDDDDE